MGHRDIKPGNMILCERGDVQDVVKLLDFGLVHVSRSAGDEDAEDSLSTEMEADGEREATSSRSRDLDPALLTQIGMLVGTPAYMAPEQVCGEPTDARSDIYSLGGVAYFLLTGQPPFTRPTIEELCAAHVTDPPPRLRDFDDSLPEELEEIITRCMAKDRLARFQTAAELNAALARTAAAGEWDSARAEAWWQAQTSPTTPRQGNRAPLPAPSAAESASQVEPITVARTDGFADTLLGD